jgi:hypothetical protein
MSAPQVSTAFIDLFASQTEPKAIATYGELESYLYTRPSVKDYTPIKQRLSNTAMVR